MSNNTFPEKVKKVWGVLKKKNKSRKARFKYRRGKFRLWFKDFRKGDDITNTKKAAFSIIMDGLLISGITYFWIGFGWAYVLAFGAGWFFLKNQGLTQVKQVLASLSLVRIGK